MKKSVLIVDDHPTMRKGLAVLLQESGHFNIVGEADSPSTVFAMIPRINPDLVLLDLSLGSEDGLEAIRKILMLVPKIGIVVHSMHDESIFAERVLQAGALGYVMKSETCESVVEALLRAAKGEVFLSSRMAAMLLTKTFHPQTPTDSTFDAQLSNRELQVLLRLGEGQGLTQIARDLDLSVKTVEYYRERLKIKLSMDSASKLTQFAIHWAQA